jgi:hypothetical protein
MESLTAYVLFSNIKGTCSLNVKKPVSAASAKKCGLSISIGLLLRGTDCRKPIYIHG